MDGTQSFSREDTEVTFFSGAAQNYSAIFSPPSVDDSAVVIISGCPLYGDCLQRAAAHALPNSILAFGKADAYVATGTTDAALLIFCVSGVSPQDAEAQLETLLAAADTKTAIVVVGDDESASRVRHLIGKGIRGYIPTSLHLSATVEALNLIMAGGTFAPADSLLQPRRDGALDIAPIAGTADQLVFTAKQMAVIEAIRRGKANKVIAYELNMCESTVKVHVRNIMKKLQAKNRTQVALLTRHFAQPRA